MQQRLMLHGLRNDTNVFSVKISIRGCSIEQTAHTKIEHHTPVAIAKVVASVVKIPLVWVCDSQSRLHHLCRCCTGKLKLLQYWLSRLSPPPPYPRHVTSWCCKRVRCRPRCGVQILKDSDFPIEFTEKYKIADNATGDFVLQVTQNKNSNVRSTICNVLGT